ncbi:phage NrS-1 polymerase family protein [Natronorubrum sp. FCH18a]|uniref:phage NrS-1 polymerase family protein n=1 Tax=Natronorubrum sp. FCH18a TaxID=3447018 RepID=UPI003F51525F
MSSSTNQQGEHAWGDIPEPLRKRNQWIVTKEKGPIKPTHGWQHSDNQLSFKEACTVATSHDGEPAFALRAEDPYVILDFDHVRQSVGGHITEELAVILDRLNTYSESSRSGEGLHTVCIGSLLPGRTGQAKLEERGKMEVFDSGQYVVLTGDQIGSYNSIRDFNTEEISKGNPLLDVQREYLPKRTEPIKKDPEVSEFDLESVSDQSINLAPEQIKRTLEEYAKSGSQEAKRALSRWMSPSGSDREFPSGSEADLGFVSDLAFWCEEDVHLIDQCFRRSRRMRGKWDEVHYTNGRTYGDATIQVAIRSNYDTFSGHHVRTN